MSDKAVFTRYLKELFAVALQGDAREESFYPTLAEMLADIAKATGRAHVRVTTLPKPTDAGNPDFRLWNGTDRIIGYVEAKKPTEDRLDVIEESEQLTRYRSTFPNLILTNFLEFRLYRNGERVETVLAARPMVLNRLRTMPPVEKPEELHALLDRFLGFSLPKAFTAESLAVELAKRTRFLRDVVAQQLEQEKDAPGMLAGFFEAFHTYLIGTLTPEDFADLFAQTITYGLFAARTRAGDGFSRRTAYDNIPHTIGVLRHLFRFISLDDLPEQLAWCVDDIAEVVKDGLDARQGAVKEAEVIIDSSVSDFLHWMESREAVPTIRALRDHAERNRRHELEKALKKGRKPVTESVRKRPFSLYRRSVQSVKSGIEEQVDAFKKSDLEALLTDLRELVALVEGRLPEALDDGGEVDMDFGHYERFLGVTCKFEWNLTMGKVYKTILEREREGYYLGHTVQLIPHVTDVIKEWFYEIPGQLQADIALIEIGGTVGDMENELYIEAVRQLRHEVGDENVIFVHLTYVPMPTGVDEQKSKPTQQSVKLLNERGIRPDVIIGRCQERLTEKIKKKVGLFCNIDPKAVISGVDVESVYQIPLVFEEEGLTEILHKRLSIYSPPNLDQWRSLVSRLLAPTGPEIRVAICGVCHTELDEIEGSSLEAASSSSTAR